MGVDCAVCGEPIGDTWVEVIVRDTMGEDLIHNVVFLDSSACLMSYAENVVKNES